MKKLLIENTSLIYAEKSKIIESIHKNDGRLIIKNVLLQRADTPNRNRRIYPKRILERELNTYFDKIRERRAFGECDHPEESIINLKNVCQAIIDARWKGNEIYGDIEVLKTPSGNIIKEILLAGFRIGQSSRGMGSVESIDGKFEDDIVEVQEDFELVTLADAVSDESTIGANMRLNENKNNNNLVKSKINMLIQDITCDLSGVCCHMN